MPLATSIRPVRQSIIAAALVVAAGCSASSASQGAVLSGASTVVAPTTTTARTPPPTVTSAAPVKTSPSVLGVAVHGDKLMPDVVCMNLQEAQDLIQTHGVFYSRSVDATGKGRHQIVDRNWVVVAQTPPAGSPIGEGDAVLSVVKVDESNAC